MTTQSTEEGASLRLSDMVSGGLINNVNAAITAASIVTWDYGQPEEGRLTVAAKVSLLQDDGTTTEQYYSGADPKFWRPSTDGKRFIPTGAQRQLNSSTNLAVMLKELIGLQFPEDKIGRDISVLVGLYAYWQRKAVARDGLRRESKDKNAEAPQPQTVLVPTTIFNFPWEPSKSPALAKPQSAGRPAAPTPTPTPTPASAPTDIEVEALLFIQEQLVRAGGQIPKTQLTGLVFSELAQAPNRNAIARLIFDDAFLNRLAAEGAIQYLNGTITLT